MDFQSSKNSSNLVYSNLKYLNKPKSIDYIIILYIFIGLISTMVFEIGANKVLDLRNCILGPFQTLCRGFHFYISMKYTRRP